MSIATTFTGQTIIQDGLPDPWLSRIWILFDKYEVIEFKIFV